MKRIGTRVGLALAFVFACGIATEAMAVVTQADANRAGLTRAWLVQIGAPRSTGAIVHLHHDKGTLLVQTEQGMLAALDAETGRVLWNTQVGPRDRLCSEPTVNEDYVVVVNGSTVYVLDRATGKLMWQKQVSGAPGSGPAVSATHVFIPLVNGMIEAYQLDRGSKQSPRHFNSNGRVLIPPVVTEQTVSWTTEKGQLYVLDSAAMKVDYRLETRGAIHGQPAYWTPNLYACSTDGCVYAVNEDSGRIVWKFTAGDPFHEPPVAIEERVYAVSQLGGMYCLDGDTGKQLWNVRQGRQFLAKSQDRVYVADRGGRMLILDANSGRLAGNMPLEGVRHKLTNHASDRIYLADESGVVQCLRELDQKKAVAYAPPAKATLEDRVKQLRSPTRGTAAAVTPPTPPVTSPPPADDDFTAPPVEATPLDTRPADPAGSNPFDDPFR